MSSLHTAHLTPEQYLEIERNAETKSEYFDGTMYAMSGGTDRHSRIGFEFSVLVGSHLQWKGCRGYTSDMRVLIESSGFYTYPDLTVVCGEPLYKDDRRDTLINPVLLVEVLSPSTERHDRLFKREKYFSIPSLREYLILRQDSPLVELYRRHEDETWRGFNVAGLDAVVRLESIEFTLVLGDLYRRILSE